MLPPLKQIILPVPHFQQRKIGDCLVACTGMMLAHLGKAFQYRNVAQQLKTQDFGTVFSNIRHLSISGIAVQVHHGDIDDLYRHLLQNRPAAVAVRTAELPHWYNDASRFEEVAHAIVVVGMDKKMVYINDPAFETAPLQVSHGEFQLARIDFDELYAVLLQK